MIAALKTAGANINAVVTADNQNGGAGMTALHIAAHKGHHQVLVALINEGASIDAVVTDANTSGMKGVTALQIAAVKGHENITEHLQRVQAGQEQSQQAQGVGGSPAETYGPGAVASAAHAVLQSPRERKRKYKNPSAEDTPSKKHQYER